MSRVYDSSVLEFSTSTFGIAGTRLGPLGARIPEFTPYDSNSDSDFSYRGFARKFIVWDSLTSGYWERTQTVWTGAGANEPHVLELIDKPVRFFGSRMNRIGAPGTVNLMAAGERLSPIAFVKRPLLLPAIPPWLRCEIGEASGGKSGGAGR